MLRTFLIVLATILAGGFIWLAHDIPTRADMKKWAQVLVGLSIFFATFFTLVRIVDDYAWWMLPTTAFIIAMLQSLVSLGDINRLIKRNQPDQWLVNTLAAAGTPITGTVAPSTTEEPVRALSPRLDDEDLDLFADYEPEHETRPRRFMDDFVIADEADLGPGELELEHLDDFIFTARHGFLVHNRGQDVAPCDVVTIHPGMSVADLIEAAKHHKDRCVVEEVTVA